MKIYKVDSAKIILFRLSNGVIQAHDYDKNMHLLMTDNTIMMIEIEDGK
jgi:hypothetical protein